MPHRTSEQRVEAIAALRRLRFTGPEIAEVLDMPLSTVSGILTRIGMGKLGRLGLEPAVRYERQRPGELIHIDIKRLGPIQRGAGSGSPGRPPAACGQLARTHSASGAKPRAGSASTSRSMTAPAWPTPRSWPIRARRTVIGFLRRAVAFYACHGITVEPVLTGNGGAYRSTIHAAACRTLGIRHLRTRAYRPQTKMGLTPMQTSVRLLWR